MAEVRIPFCPRMADAAIDGVLDPLTGERFWKTWTTRGHWYGKEGDCFPVKDVLFQLVGLQRVPLEEVSLHYQKEGCISQQDFVDLWVSLHKRAGWRPDLLGHVHIFRKVA